MNYYRTESGGTTTINTLRPSPVLGEYCQNMWSNKIPIKYQEVIRLVDQYSGNPSDWKDDKFILTGIKNLLIGR